VRIGKRISFSLGGVCSTFADNDDGTPLYLTPRERVNTILTHFLRWVVLSDCQLQRPGRLARIASGRSAEKGRLRIIFRRMDALRTNPLTSRLRLATARQAILSPFTRGERRHKPGRS